MTTTLQASLVYKPPPPLPSSPSSSRLHSFTFTSYRFHLPNPRLSLHRCNSSSNTNLLFGVVSRLNKFHPDSASFHSCICRHSRLSIANCTLHHSGDVNLASPDNANSNNKVSSNSDLDVHNLNNESVSGGESGSGENAGNETLVPELEPERKLLGEGDSADLEEVKTKLPILAFFLGFFAMAGRGFEKFMSSEWLSWWPFWRQEKRLERLILEADANPKDVAVQSALLAELNKHSPEEVIRRFERRDHAVDSRGVAEYIRAIVATNAISDYLPDEQSGKPSSLPSLVLV